MPNKTLSGASLLALGELPVFERGGGARTTPLVTKAIGASGLITGYTELDPGTHIPFHSHNCEESVVLIEGDAMMDIEDQEYRMKPLDSTFIPANVPHRFRNLSDTKRMKILWIYANADATRTLIETGITSPISAEHDK